MAPMTQFSGPDYSNQPLLPAWYTLGWTTQAPDYLPAPTNPFNVLALPSDQVYCEVIGNYVDGNGNPLGGYLTFEQSDNITLTESGNYWRIPSGLVGITPSGDWWAYNYQSSGKIYLGFGGLQVILMATNNPNITTDSGAALVYHVKEYFYGGRNFDITVPGADDLVTTDINTLMVSGTIEPNLMWNRGY
jgi:hypothetical protein